MLGCVVHHGVASGRPIYQRLQMHKTIWAFPSATRFAEKEAEGATAKGKQSAGGDQPSGGGGRRAPSGDFERQGRRQRRSPNG